MVFVSIKTHSKSILLLVKLNSKTLDTHHHMFDSTNLFTITNRKGTLDIRNKLHH